MRSAESNHGLSFEREMFYILMECFSQGDNEKKNKQTKTQPILYCIEKVQWPTKITAEKRIRHLKKMPTTHIHAERLLLRPV